jgi:hypothetical protein
MQRTSSPELSSTEARSIASRWRSVSGYRKAFVILFFLTLPFLDGKVEGDGIGYYAYLRSPLIDHNLAFATDWPSPHDIEKVLLVDHFLSNPVRKAGHPPNFYTVGPALLWAPFVMSAHVVVIALNGLGVHIPPDGLSWPYMAAMRLATALYAFAGLWLSFLMARKFVAERWAFWATIGIWFGSSLPVYMYLHTSWSHAHSAFAASLFLWYWLRTREARTARQWLVLGLLAGLMIDVYYLNGVFLLAPAWEAGAAYARAWQTPSSTLNLLANTLQGHALGVLGGLAALLPTFITRQIVFGNPFAVGPYSFGLWNWNAPAFGQVLFDGTHGLFVVTPILVLAFLGLFSLWRLDRSFGSICLSIAIIFYCLISFYPWWNGVYSFGNRFFVSLTPLFVLGLAAALSVATRLWGTARSASLRLVPVILIFVIWNLGLVYQWRTHLMPSRSEIYWEEVIYTQFRDVPRQALHDLAAKFFFRGN